jgi:hypothetical protein
MRHGHSDSRSAVVDAETESSICPAKQAYCGHGHSSDAHGIPCTKTMAATQRLSSPCERRLSAGFLRFCVQSLEYKMARVTEMAIRIKIANSQA